MGNAWDINISCRGRDLFQVWLIRDMIRNTEQRHKIYNVNLAMGKYINHNQLTSLGILLSLMFSPFPSKFLITFPWFIYYQRVIHPLEYRRDGNSRIGASAKSTHVQDRLDTDTSIVAIGKTRMIWLPKLHSLFLCHIPKSTKKSSKRHHYQPLWHLTNNATNDSTARSWPSLLRCHIPKTTKKSSKMHHYQPLWHLITNATNDSTARSSPSS